MVEGNGNGDEKYPRGWDDECLFLTTNENPPSGPVGYRRRGPVFPTPLPRGT